MSPTTQLLILVIAFAVLVISVLVIQRRQRADRASRTGEHEFATSTEGQKRCPHCGMFNLWTDRNCISCKRRLPG
jgi:hypothetical protein